MAGIGVLRGAAIQYAYFIYSPVYTVGELVRPAGSSPRGAEASRPPNMAPLIYQGGPAGPLASRPPLSDVSEECDAATRADSTAHPVPE